VLWAISLLCGGALFPKPPLGTDETDERGPLAVVLLERSRW
jgi:hypothetical protein